MTKSPILYDTPASSLSSSAGAWRRGSSGHRYASRW